MHSANLAYDKSQDLVRESEVEERVAELQHRVNPEEALGLLIRLALDPALSALRDQVDLLGKIALLSDHAVDFRCEPGTFHREDAAQELEILDVKSERRDAGIHRTWFHSENEEQIVRFVQCADREPWSRRGGRP